MLNNLIQYIQNLAESVPLPLFALLGSFIEEIFAPIPSPMVMGLAGSIAKEQNRPFFYILLIAIIAAFAKTITSYIYYIIADKAEDLLLSRFGKFIGISHKEVEQLGKHFNGSLRDDFIIFIFRVLPIFPTPVVSAVCGLVKINMFSYLRASFLGFILRNLMFLYAGYMGIEILNEITEGSSVYDIVKYSLVLLLLIGPFASSEIISSVKPKLSGINASDT